THGGDRHRDGVVVVVSGSGCPATHRVLGDHADLRARLSHERLVAHYSPRPCHHVHRFGDLVSGGLAARRPGPPPGPGRRVMNSPLLEIDDLEVISRRDGATVTLIDGVRL